MKVTFVKLPFVLIHLTKLTKCQLRHGIEYADAPSLSSVSTLVLGDA